MYWAATAWDQVGVVDLVGRGWIRPFGSGVDQTQNALKKFRLAGRALERETSVGYAREPGYHHDIQDFSCLPEACPTPPDHPAVPMAKQPRVQKPLPLQAERLLNPSSASPMNAPVPSSGLTAVESRASTSSSGPIRSCTQDSRESHYFNELRESSVPRHRAGGSHPKTKAKKGS